MSRDSIHAMSESKPKQPSSAPPQRAGLWRRFGAFVHELLFLTAYLFIVGLIFAAFSGESMSAGRPQILSGPIAVFQQLYLFVTIGAYFIFFWIKGRRTLAFKTWHLRLLDVAGNAPSMKHAVIRYLATWIGPALAVAIFAIGGKTVGGWWILALFANFFWALVERDRRFLHDRIAGTRVVFSLE
jgi:uncharacterized RDD family membrane protein YckC